MANPNGRKGRDWENDCLEMLSGLFPYIYYGGKQGVVDKGDFVNTLPFCFEAKNHKAINLAQFMDEAVAEAKNASADFPVVLIKRRQKHKTKGYAVMEIGAFLELISRIQGEP